MSSVTRLLLVTACALSLLGLMTSGSGVISCGDVQCQNDAACVSVTPGGAPKCHCKDGFSGKDCGQHANVTVGMMQSAAKDPSNPSAHLKSSTFIFGSIVGTQAVIVGIAAAVLFTYASKRKKKTVHGADDDYSVESGFELTSDNDDYVLHRSASLLSLAESKKIPSSAGNSMADSRSIRREGPHACEGTFSCELTEEASEADELVQEDSAAESLAAVASVAEEVATEETTNDESVVEEAIVAEVANVQSEMFDDSSIDESVMHDFSAAVGISGELGQVISVTHGETTEDDLDGASMVAHYASEHSASQAEDTGVSQSSLSVQSNIVYSDSNK